MKYSWKILENDLTFGAEDSKANKQKSENLFLL